MAGPRALALLALLAGAPAAAAAITRGPFLQLGGARSMTVVVLTDAPAVARVRYGPAPDALTSRVEGAGPATSHALALTGLVPATRYFYEVDLDGEVAARGPDLAFRTYPPPGTPAHFRFLAWGDSGNESAEQMAVAARMAGEVGEPALALILGDIIYPLGEASLYDPRFFRPYAPLLRRMVIWPAIGNHDVETEGGQPFRDAFHLPADNPAGVETYYSFDYGDAHFVCLDTHASDHSRDGAQLRWAAADLAASSARWKIAYFHRPPYSGGTHPDDPEVIAGIVPVLEAANVDLVFAGHSHVLERTYLLRSGALVQADRARYSKPPGAPGTLYVVSGSGGQVGMLFFNSAHPLMAFQKGDVAAHSVVDVTPSEIRGYFMDSAGQAWDLFTLSREADADPPRVIGVRGGPETSRVVLSFNEPVDPAGAEDPSSYSISPRVAVTSAALGSDGRTVTLTTTRQAPGLYTLGVTGVADLAAPANRIAGGTRVEYLFDPTPPPPLPGPAPSAACGCSGRAVATSWAALALVALALARLGRRARR